MIKDRIELITKEALIELKKTTIFISGSTPSSKNNQMYLVDREVLVASASAQKWKRKTKREFEEKGIIFLNQTLNLSFPYYIEFTFARKTSADFDYINATQIVQDAMVKHSWIEDDCMRLLKPYFGDFFIDRDNPGVYIRVLKTKPTHY